MRVFDAASNIKEITVADHAIALQTTPDGATLSGEEFYTVTNQSNPPRTLTGQHTFEIYLPEGASIVETSVQTGKTQLKAALVPTSEKNKYAFVFPIRPGQTQFHVMYTVPYSGKLQIDPKTDPASGNPDGGSAGFDEGYARLTPPSTRSRPIRSSRT